jgi:hypothetical protein
VEKKKQEKFFDSAATRTLELIDLTLADKRWHNYRLTELARLRDEVCSVLYTENSFSASTQGLQRYFHSMAYLARLK